MEGESAFSLLPCGEQIGLAGFASPCHLFLKGAKETAKMSESSSEDLNGVMLSFHKKTLKFKKQILKAGIGQGTPAIQIAGKPATIKKSQC